MVAKALGIVPAPKFSQATIVTGALLGAWVFWLLVNNKVGTYWSILTGSGAAAQPSSSYPGSSSSSSTSGKSTASSVSTGLGVFNPLTALPGAIGGIFGH